MKVYAVEECEPYGSCEVLKIFKSKDKAELCAEIFYKEDELDWYEYIVTEIEADLDE